MKIRLLFVIAISISVLNLQGCFTVVAAGAGTVAVASHDRRTSGAFVDDAAIEFKARNNIYGDKRLRGRIHISVTSMNGRVLLTGEAPTVWSRNLAVGLVEKIKGVRRILNHITIDSPSKLSSRSKDTWITSKVKGKMFAAKNFDATRIKVVTERQVVYLLGLVKRREASQAINIAKTVTRVTKIVARFEYID